MCLLLTVLSFLVSRDKDAELNSPSAPESFCPI